MRLLILGCGSFAGQVLYENFLKKGYQVYGINRSKPKNSSYWEWMGEEIKTLNWQEINLNSNPLECANAIKKIAPTHIIDLMGQGMVAQSWNDPLLWYETNLSKKSLILETIRNLDTLEKYVRASTPEVFGSNDNLIDEKQNFNPSSPYAVSHSAIDFHIRILGKEYDFPYLIGRFANFYGEGQQLYRVIPRAILSCINKKKFIIDGKGSSSRRFIYSSDIVSAVEALLFKAPIKNEYNFSGNQDITILNLIKLICKLTSSNFNEVIKYGPERLGKDMTYKLNCEKSKKELNWEPKTELKNGIINVIGWVERNKNFLSKESWEYMHLL